MIIGPRIGLTANGLGLGLTPTGAGYTGTGIQKAMSEIKEYDGVGGKLFIDEDGNSRVESVSFRTINNMELGPPERL